MQTSSLKLIHYSHVYRKDHNLNVQDRICTLSPVVAKYRSRVQRLRSNRLRTSNMACGIPVVEDYISCQKLSVSEFGLCAKDCTLLT